MQNVGRQQRQLHELRLVVVRGVNDLRRLHRPLHGARGNQINLAANLTQAARGELHFLVAM